MTKLFSKRLQDLCLKQTKLIDLKNTKSGIGNGVVDRYKYPILTADHIPVSWRYDLNYKTNPFLLERLGVNAVFNSGAMKFGDRYLLVNRIESKNRKSFFAISESPNGIDSFRFWDRPMLIPPGDSGETNLYDMRLTQHEDGWVYGVFCTERHDMENAGGDQSAALSGCGIIRTKGMRKWERLNDIKTPSSQQRNVVLHPELVNGKYAFYTRPQDGFIEPGNSGGIGFGLCDSIEQAVIKKEKVIDRQVYHTVYELKNGLGPAPIKTKYGWLQLAHGVRSTAAGLRYVLYLFMTALEDPSKVIYKPGGYFMAPEGQEQFGDVSNVLFSNGWILDGDKIYIYYASSDTRMHVATSSLEKLIDYTLHTPADPLTTFGTTQNINKLIDKNQPFLKNESELGEGLKDSNSNRLNS